MYLSFDLKTTDFDQMKALFIKLGYKYFGENEDSLYQGPTPLPAHEFRMTYPWIQNHLFLRIEHNKLGTGTNWRLKIFGHADIIYQSIFSPDPTDTFFPHHFYSYEGYITQELERIEKALEKEKMGKTYQLYS